MLTLARGGALHPLLMSDAFSALFHTLIKLCYTKALEWSSLVPDLKVKSSEITNPTPFIISYHNHLILCHPRLLLPSIFPSIRVFSNDLVLHIRWPKVLGVSASASVLTMNIQDWFPLGLTGWISLQSKGLSRVFSNTTVQKHQFFGTQLSL